MFQNVDAFFSMNASLAQYQSASGVWENPLVRGLPFVNAGRKAKMLQSFLDSRRSKSAHRQLVDRILGPDTTFQTTYLVDDDWAQSGARSTSPRPRGEPVLPLGRGEVEPAPVLPADRFFHVPNLKYWRAGSSSTSAGRGGERILDEYDWAWGGLGSYFAGDVTMIKDMVLGEGTLWRGGGSPEEQRRAALREAARVLKLGQKGISFEPMGPLN